MNNKVFISTAYIYPVCPLSFNHARMFVIADVYARYSKLKNQNCEVYYPIATHYSGNTAHKMSNELHDYFNGNKTESSEKIFNLYSKTYQVNREIIKQFEDPKYLLDYFNEECLWELKSLHIQADYSRSYTSIEDDFSYFVNAVIAQYLKLGLVQIKGLDNIGIKYENIDWTNDTKKQIESSQIISPSQKKIIYSGLNNINSNWNLLRSKNNGIGVDYNGYTVDPMFDSELFTIFDLYIKFRDDYPDLNKKEFFAGLLETIKEKSLPKNDLEEKILEWLPCNIYVCEEHLRNWIAKKFYTEQALLDEQYRTNKYIIIGMGFLERKRMSASRGTAILSKDLIVKYGPLKSRLLMLYQGGHLSKDFNYKISNEKEINTMLQKFNVFFTNLLIQIPLKSSHERIRDKQILEFKNRIDSCIESGYIRTAIDILFNSIINTYSVEDNKIILKQILTIFIEYGNVLLPGLLEGY